MKILHVISDENIGGAGVLLCNLLRHFDRSCVESVVALPRGSLLTERVQALGVATVELIHPCDRFSSASVREICGVIRESGAELVHTNAAICARVAGKRVGIGVLLTRHCCYPPPAHWRFPPVRWLGGLCNRMICDAAIATAEVAADNLRAYGMPKRKIHVVINGSDAVRTPTESELSAARARYGIEAGDYVIGICARLERCKGQDVFLRAAKRVSEALPHVKFRFLVVGSGSEEADLRALAASLGIADRVCFTGFVDDMAPVYHLLRININCSRGTETSCLALSEGMSAGVPMVISDYGGNPAMLGGTLAGFLFPKDNDAMLSEVICRIAANPCLESQMRAAARARYEQCYTAEEMTRAVCALYRQLLKPKT